MVNVLALLPMSPPETCQGQLQGTVSTVPLALLTLSPCSLSLGKTRPSGGLGFPLTLSCFPDLLYLL